MNVRKYIILVGGVFAIGMSGCDRDLTQTDTCYDKRLVITGGSYSDFSGMQSRASSDKMENGDKILMYATGGLTADTEELTYANGIWQQASPLTWNEQAKDAEVLAYYPAENIKNNNLYQENGALIDVLYNSQTVAYKNNITLSFGHLFSKLNFIIDKNLNNKIEYVEFTPSATVNHIDLHTATYVCSEQSNRTIRIARQNSRNYSLIIPADENLSVGITLVTANGCKTATVAARAYKRGTLYQCNIKEEKNGAGIYTADDFIAFTNLINQNTYEGRSLDEFREDNGDGTYTYYLKNDIVLTDEDNAKILLGKNERIVFNDVLDGMNHTISNLKIMPGTSKPYRLALLMNNEGTVKNVKLNNAQGTFTQKSYLALLVAYNKGFIDNCHVKNSTISVDNEASDQNTGAIAALNIGVIINCSCEGVSIKSKKKNTYLSAGMIVSNHNSAKGKVMNCYAYNCNVTNAALAGGICVRMLDGSTVENCYTRKITFNNIKTSSRGELVASFSNSFVKNCFYEYGKRAIGEQATPKSNLAYSDTITDPAQAIPTSEVATRLNKWISTTGISSFSEYKFTEWTQGEDIPAIFIN